MTIYYAYILRCNDGKKYYGHTNNLTERIKEHKRGRVNATRNKQPELAYYQECMSRSEAVKIEMGFKNGRTRKSTIERLINDFPKSKCQGFNSRSDLCRPPLADFHKSRAH